MINANLAGNPERDPNMDLDQTLAQLIGTQLEGREVEAILASFTARNGLPPLSFDGDGMAELSIGNEVELALFHLPSFPGLMVAACLPDALAAHPDLGRALLQANLSWSETGGATFAKFPNDGPFALCRGISLADRDDQAFERQLLSFSEQAAGWIDELEMALDLEPEMAVKMATGDDPPQRPTPPTAYA